MILIGTKKHLKNSNLFLIKALDKLGKEGNFLKVVKGIYEYHTPNFIFNDERLKVVPPKEK